MKEEGIRKGAFFNVGKVASVRSSEYWKKRFLELEEKQYRRGEAYYKDLQNQFRIAQNSITLDVEHWYQRLADNNGISLASAKKLLKKNELEEFHWNVNQYIRYGEENAINGTWVKQLENASVKQHISYLESMKLQIQQHCELLSARYHSGVTNFLGNEYADSFYRTAFEIQNGKKVYSNLAKLDTRVIDTVLTKPWASDGRSFSDRIWSNKEKLVRELHNELTQCLIRGYDPQKATDNLAQIMNVSKTQAGRLVMTELAAVRVTSRLDSLKELNVEQYEIVATLDSHTSEICQEMDGKQFRLSDFEIGATAPPFHPNCRTDIVPYFGDEFDDLGERAARGADGKTYYVPANITYKQWQQSFVDGDKSGLQEDKIDDTIISMDITKDWTKTRGKKGSVIEKLSYIVNGTTYVVDGVHIILKPSEQERKVAEILSGEYGKTVELVPQVVYPQGIQTPDYLIDGERFDLKSPTGSGKNLIYGLIAKKRKQAGNFIIDISKCPLSEKEVEKQIENLYTSPRLGFLEKVILIKDGEVIKVYSRK